MAKKKKIIVNEDLQSIFNYVSTNENVVTWQELIMFVTDYHIYEQLYLNHMIIEKLVNEHNISVLNGTYVKKN